MKKKKKTTTTMEEKNKLRCPSEFMKRILLLLLFETARDGQMLSGNRFVSSYSSSVHSLVRPFVRPFYHLLAVAAPMAGAAGATAPPTLAEAAELRHLFFYPFTFLCAHPSYFNKFYGVPFSVFFML